MVYENTDPVRGRLEDPTTWWQAAVAFVVVRLAFIPIVGWVADYFLIKYFIKLRYRRLPKNWFMAAIAVVFGILWADAMFFVALSPVIAIAVGVAMGPEDVSFVVLAGLLSLALAAVFWAIEDAVLWFSGTRGHHAAMEN